MRDSDIDSLSADGAQDTEKMAGLRTAAGRRLADLYPYQRESILIIEAEAAEPAPLDADLLRLASDRTAVEFVYVGPGHLPDGQDPLDNLLAEYARLARVPDAD